MFIQTTARSHNLYMACILSGWPPPLLSAEGPPSPILTICQRQTLLSLVTRNGLAEARCDRARQKARRNKSLFLLHMRRGDRRATGAICRQPKCGDSDRGLGPCRPSQGASPFCLKKEGRWPISEAAAPAARPRLHFARLAFWWCETFDLFSVQARAGWLPRKTVRPHCAGRRSSSPRSRPPPWR